MRHSDVQRCPRRSLLAEHYLSDGRCGCFLDPTLAVREHIEALREWIAAKGPAIDSTRVRLDASRVALVEAREQMAMPW